MSIKRGAIGLMAGIAAVSALTCVGSIVGHIGAGVAREVAQMRRERVDSLRYSLRFSIPEDSKGVVRAHEQISFNLVDGGGTGVLPLDFSGPHEGVKQLRVNGILQIPTISDDHILIPDSLLQPGENSIEIEFETSGASMNRRGDYLFTLFVPFKAHACFPCFDQPDMKGRYDLTLELPADWHSVANGGIVSDTVSGDGKRRTVTYHTTEPLSTYLVAFAAGRFNYDRFNIGGREIGIFHREKEGQKLSQLPGIADEVARSINWLEDYTGVPYPFMKYDLAILPGFPFSGMEHTGATFYNDSKLFLGANPTPDERLTRTALIAHETAHMWFGDYVTMRWFDDVWTKEVFANYFAAAMTRDMAPEFDHDLQWLRRYQDAAMSLDRTLGSTSIRQPLPNMLDAGLIYNNIIYNKAPVMMLKLRNMIGEKNFKDAIRQYMASFPYGNASWSELVDILAAKGGEQVREFSKAWVDEAGCPRYEVRILNDSLRVRQTDLRGSTTIWPQSFGVRIIKGKDIADVEVEMKPGVGETAVLLPRKFLRKKNDGVTLLPNFDGRGYGIFDAGEHSVRALMSAFCREGAASILNQGVRVTPSGRMALLLNLRELFLAKEIPSQEWSKTLLAMLRVEKDPLLALSEVEWLGELLPRAGEYAEVESQLRELVNGDISMPLRVEILRKLATASRTPETVAMIYDLWRSGDTKMLSENDLTNFTYELAIRLPEQGDEIIETQRRRITNPDRLDNYNFTVRAVSPRRADRDAMFADLLKAENRTQEPRALKALSLLTHFLRGGESVERIEPALEILPEIQTTGDIFFPANWCKNLLSSQRTPEARAAVNRYLAAHPDLKPLLRNKVLGELHVTGVR